MQSALVLAAAVAYLAAAFLWPTLRLWRRHGVWPIVFERNAAPAQRLLGLLTRALPIAVLVPAILRFVVDPSTLGLWNAAWPVHAVGWLCIGSGGLLTVLAQRQMGMSWRIGIDDRRTELVTEGIFAYVRNPIFGGLLLFLAGYACLMPACWSIAVWLLTAMGIRVQVALEEKHLLRLHQEAYRGYAVRAGRFVPLVGRFHSPAQD
jgi:protein-S-isoprenylcysteine O-methyltransferase Ste14